MMKKIISMFLTALMAATMLFANMLPAYAAETADGNGESGKYISMVKVSSEKNRELTTSNLYAQGVKHMVDFDFNYGTGKNYAFVGFNRTDDKEDAITGLMTLHNGGSPDTVDYNGITYYLTNNVDFNKGNGDSQDDIFLYYTKDLNAGTPITDLSGSESCKFRDNWFILKNFSGEVSALTRNYKEGVGVNECEAYMFYSRDEAPPTYISQIAVASAGSEFDTVNQLILWDYNYGLGYDFNHSTGKNYAYVGFNRTENADEAITGLLTLVNEGIPQTTQYNGITYYLANDVDFNKGNGSSTADIFLYYTKDPAAGAPITKICGYDYSSQDGWEAVCRSDGHPSDLNKSTGAGDAFLLFERAVLNANTTLGSVFGSHNILIITVAVVALAAAGITGIIVLRKRKASQSNLK